MFRRVFTQLSCNDLHTIQHEYRLDIRYGPEKLWPLCTLIRRGQICTLVRRGQFGRRISHTVDTFFVAALSTSQHFKLFRRSQTDFIEP